MNDGDQALSLIYLIGLLVLVGSSIMVRRIPMKTGVKMLAAWALIFAALFAVVALRDDFTALGKRMLGELRGEAKMVQAGAELRIKKSSDGHFWVNAELNGKKVDLMVDSGATITSISAGAAQLAGIEPSSRFPVLVETANGTVTMARGRTRLKVGSIERDDFPVHISRRTDDETSVLGMNFLSSLSGWGVQGEWLILRP